MAVAQMMNRMMDGMSGYGGWMMTGMAVFWLLTLAVLALGIVALIKYLRTPSR